jgi:hypothetical protein
VSLKRHRTAVILVLANYVLALTVGEALHVHGDGGCRRGVAGCAPASAHGLTGWLVAPLLDGPPACAHHEAAITASGAGWIHSGICLVCQFLAQKPVPSHRVEAVACTGVVADVVPATAVRGAAPAGSPHPIRGPPSVA